MSNSTVRVQVKRFRAFSRTYELDFYLLVFPVGVSMWLPAHDVLLEFRQRWPTTFRSHAHQPQVRLSRVRAVVVVHRRNPAHN